MSVSGKKTAIIASVSALIGVVIGAVGAFLIDEKCFTYRSLLAELKRDAEQQFGEELASELGDQP